MKSKRKLMVFILVCLVVIIPIIGSFIYLYMPVSSRDRTFEVRIKKGDEKSAVIKKLEKLGAVKIPLVASMYLDFKDAKDVKPGTYKFSTSVSVKSMLDSIAGDKVNGDYLIKVTIPEGFTAVQIANKLVSDGVITDKNSFMNEINKGDFSSFKFISTASEGRPIRLEGYLYPDTYEFRKGSSNQEIINAMLESYEDNAYPIVKEGAKRLSVGEDEILKMASVIEKEARSDEERPIISGVFYNRLKSKMRLQSCATVLYALGRHKDKLYYKDLEVNSPYNTYRNIGLPIGPISNPGIKSLKAAADPKSHDYIYFVLQNNGKHFFTKDYNEFLKAKKASNSI
ncbi:endolytic transglycosylase MltG [Clostridium cylindrosporum]|uniref:Endolytic murein transglycosylase n=1 Tax=Clostridium cylindrosporum DSM 605 TaxID=1121307 RepID=A0A0J8G0I8_CLOCY|nr:endolytic transglycosylase MltG [Clostridium cylindrosporum]KMT21311.1 ABC transporter substrate-binding protein [Clostridium cylindrosporum DSM 605]